MLFQIALMYAIGAAFSQRVWYTFRRRSLEVAMIDKLLSLPTTPWAFLNWKIFVRHHVEWWYGVFVLGTAIALTFPPSAMVIQSIERSNHNDTIHISTLDLNTFGYKTEKIFNDTDFFTYQGGFSSTNRNMSRLYKFAELALFTMDVDLNYVYCASHHSPVAPADHTVTDYPSHKCYQ